MKTRTMRTDDLPQVLAIERDLFPEDAWSERMFQRELAGMPASRHYLVVEDADAVLAYGGLLITGGEADIQTIAVRADHWGQGIGTQLLEVLLDEARKRDCSEVFLEVRSDNDRAQALYRRFGFQPVGTRPGYYQPSNTDAVIMRRGGIRRREAKKACG